jgi:DoxX-like family
MTIQKPSAALSIGLWIAQVILAASFIWAASMKLFKPIEELSLMWPWVGQVSEGLVKFTGVVDLLGAVGLILPSVLRIRPNFTPVTAMGIILLMICASVFHIIRGEAGNIAPNIVFAILAAFIAWGRLKKAPIAQK